MCAVFKLPNHSEEWQDLGKTSKNLFYKSARANFDRDIADAILNLEHFKNFKWPIPRIRASLSLGNRNPV